MTLAPGTRIGPYEILAPIGAGGMGEVYRARDTRLKRDVAIKVLPPAVAGDRERLARFQREAEVLASLNHPHIAQVHGLEESAGTIALVMELVEGEDLSARIARGAMPLADALPIARQIADALEAAHERGIVHRDLKPANIKVRDDGTVKVLDFGLAKALAPADASAPANLMNSPTITSPATELGMILGTAAYMAPEQAKGRATDRRADVWAFGVVMLEMLTGRPVFAGDEISEVLASVLKDAPALDALPEGTPPAIRRLLARCLEKTPARRLDSMGVARWEIDLALAEPEDAAAVRAAASPAGWRRAAPWAVAALAIAVTAAMGLASAGRGVWRPSAALVTEVEYRPVTFDTGFVFSARFAGDGRSVVYSADWTGRPRDLFVASLDSRDARPLGITGADLLALGSSDEMAVLLDSSIPSGNPYVRLGALARSSVTGARARAEIENVMFADLAPDGALAIVRLTDSEVLLEYPVGTVVGRLPRVNNTYGTSGFVTPRVSPDGAHVAVLTSVGESGWRAQVFGRGGGLVFEDTVVLADWWGVAWRDAGELWFAGTEALGRQTRVYALTLGGARRLVFRAPGGLSLHDLSAEGDMLCSFDRFGRRVELIRDDGPPEDRTWRDGGVAVGLSDSGAILLDQDGDSGGPEGSVLVWAAGAERPVRIGGGSGRTISPDGSEALVLVGNVATVVPVGIGQPRPLETGPFDRIGWTGWHPDGRIVIDLVRPDGSRGTIAVAADGRSFAPFLPAAYRLHGGRLISPDGRRAIATGADGGLVRCALPAASCQPLPGRLGGDDVAGWLSDNRTVIVTRSRALPAAAERLDVDTGRRAAWRTITPLESSLSGARRLLVAPDGAVLMGYDRSHTDLYVIRGLR